MIAFYVRGQELRVSAPVIAADTLNYLTARFTFNADWNGLVKVASFSNGTDAAEIELTDDEIRAEDGLNLTAGEWSVGVIGFEAQGGEMVKRITSTVAKITVVPSTVEDGEPLPSLPSYGEQILAEVEDINDKLSSFTAEAETLSPGADATASYDTETGVFSFGIPKGEKGDPGDPGSPGSPGSPGAPGQDGISPTATVVKEGHTATITITDKEGTTTATISDGEDGTDGISPVATVEKTGKTATITITDANGTTTATVSDGEDGDPGQDGVTPSFSIGTVTTGAAGTDASATITGTDAAPVLNMTIPRGDPGEVTEEDLADALLDKADVIVDSASGAVASFPDGAAAPVVGLTVGIEPVQDLHGYDNPWPAGGGKNLLPFDSQYTDTNISITPTSTGFVFSVTGFNSGAMINGISLPAGTYTLSAKLLSGTFTETVYFGLRDSERTPVIFTTFPTDSSTKSKSNTLTSGTYMFYINQMPEGTYTIAIQLESGSTATSYSPYSNSCPITGHTGARVPRCGKNLIPGDNYQYGTNRVELGTDDPADFNVFLKAGTYTLNIVGLRTGISIYMQESRESGGTRLGTTPFATFTINADGYFRFLVYSSSGVSAQDITSVQLELGSTATSYAPYAGQVYDITFPSEAGTVYGGSRDVTTGVLTVDRAIVDLGTLTWSYNADWGGAGAFYCNTAPAGIKTNNPPTVVPNAMCTIYAAYSRNYLYGNPAVTGFCIPNSTAQVSIRDARYTDAASFKTAMSGVQLVYELATPLTYQLTPTEVEVTTLLGQNNLWASCGDVDVSYRCDTRLFIEKKLAALVAQIVNS